MLHVMREAQHTIKQLRRANEILSAKMEMVDLFACVLHTQPAVHSQGMEEDIVGKLEREIEKLTSTGEGMPKTE